MLRSYYGIFVWKKFNQKIAIENKIKTFDKQIEERNKIENAKREEESLFLRQQNENLDKYLKSIDQSKN